ncbi:toprim domain-containing protein [Segeticoccus rhizosphaerae]|uniref:toprim domain-containing protein n=1 Tax=Segeticoccus rhizosphaerae TaxID=1104777 RepID=UPI0013902887|nr:toprim domain-containing protein [Ornithinicoccus soli]
MLPLPRRHHPSLSVGGVPDRFHCFGCGATGDVIDYISRITGMPFLASVRALQDGNPFHDHSPAPAPTPTPMHARPVRVPTTSPERGYQINQLAWEHFTSPAAAAHAEAWLRHHRGIDLEPLRHETGGRPLAGYASPGRHTLTAHLRDLGVTDTELIDLDLAYQPARGREPIDSYRGRVTLPIGDSDGRIQGFLGRDTTGYPAAPKYRDPTRTPIFDKSAVLYRPTHHRLAEVATVVVVEGALDALAIAATAAQAGQSGRFAPVSASGVTVSPTQADAVLAMHHQPPVIALDPDQAGREGTARWLRLLSITAARPALVTTLPAGSDPADWLRAHGATGLAAFDRTHLLHDSPDQMHPHLPGRELVQTLLDGGVSEPVPAVLATLLPLAAQVPDHARDALLTGAEREMTAQGWNPNDQFSRALRRALDTTALQHADRYWTSRSSERPATGPTDFTPAGPPPSRSATPSLT